VVSTRDDLEHSLWRQLQSSDVVGTVLQFALFVEATLDELLVDYFVPGSRREAFEDLLLQRLSFHQKLEIFTRFRLLRASRSHADLCAVFQAARKLRNHVAHSYGYRGHGLSKLATDPTIVRWLRGFPDALRGEYKLVRRRVAALRRTKDLFTSTSMDDPRDIPF
jgi:hypothetical protein